MEHRKIINRGDKNMNSIVLLGRTTAPIELKQTQAGKSVVSFSLAVKRPFTKDTTDFFTIVAWDKQAELLSKYVGKGNQICIRGYLQTRSWDDNGQKRNTIEVVASEATFCESKKDSEGTSSPYNQNGSQSEFKTAPYVPQAYTQPNFDAVDNDPELPF
jgi:single-strand DNA-binding protein